MHQDLFSSLNAVFPLSDEIKARLVSILKKETFKKKNFLLKDGMMSNHIYFIQSGLVRIYYLKDGVEICSGLLSEGGIIISVKSFFDRVISNEFIQTLEDTTLEYISYEELESLYRDFPECNIIGKKLITSYYVMREESNYLLRKLTAQEKFQYFQNRFETLVSRVPRKDIASYLGINLETLSRLGY